ncbi:hypothetical protein I547_7609 [Mycobacterium kansasii 824]|nr:hypothetical protein I547_7609 [Mycobacterium kansasii 824]
MVRPVTAAHRIDRAVLRARRPDPASNGTYLDRDRLPRLVNNR